MHAGLVGQGDHLHASKPQQLFSKYLRVQPVWRQHSYINECDPDPILLPSTIYIYRWPSRTLRYKFHHSVQSKAFFAKGPFLEFP
jgi:hypothetical protein